MEEQKSNGHCLTSPNHISAKIHTLTSGQFTPTNLGAGLFHFKPLKEEEMTSKEVAWMPLKSITPPTLPETTLSMSRAARRKRVASAFQFQNCPDDSQVPEKLIYPKVGQFELCEAECKERQKSEDTKHQPSSLISDKYHLSQENKDKNINLLKVTPLPYQLDNIRGSNNKILTSDEERPKESSTRLGDCEEKNVIVDSRRKYFKDFRLSTIKTRLSQTVPLDCTLKMILSRESSMLGFLWPQFHLRLANDSNPIVAAKKTSSKPHSTFLISTKEDDFDENSPTYLGKIKTSIDGKVVNLFGPGLSPSNAARQHEIPRQLLATIVYGPAVKNSSRCFSLFVKKEETHYYLGFPQVKLYGPEVPLHELYKYPENKDKIQIYSSRMPTKSSQTHNHLLPIYGKTQCASLKNFILDGDDCNEVVVLGKSEESLFNLEICGPVSVLVGFGVALSSF